MNKLSLLPLLLALGCSAYASEPFTADSAGLCIAPAVPQGLGPEAFDISFDGKKHIELSRSELITVRLSRSRSYRVSLWRGNWLVKEFRLNYSAFPTGNACLRHHRGDSQWSLLPEPAGIVGCRCIGMAPNNSSKPTPLRGAA